MNLETFKSVEVKWGLVPFISLPLGAGVYDFDLGQYLIWENSFLFWKFTFIWPSKGTPISMSLKILQKLGNDS